MNKITKEHIIEAERQLLEAIKISDVETLDRLLHDDLLFIAPNGFTVTKTIDLEAHRAGTMVVEEIIPELELVNLVGDTAVVTLIYQTRGKMLGNPIEGKFRYLRVWKLVENTWKVIGGSCIQI